MSYLLDSDIIISFLKNKEPGLTLFKRLIGKKLFTSVISWIEIIYGIKKSAHPQKRKGEFEELLRLGKVVIFPLDEKIGDQFTSLKIKLEKKGEKLADFDFLIASTALVNQFVLVTGNKKHFSRIKNLKIR